MNRGNKDEEFRESIEELRLPACVHKEMLLLLLKIVSLYKKDQIVNYDTLKETFPWFKNSLSKMLNELFNRDAIENQSEKIIPTEIGLHVAAFHLPHTHIDLFYKFRNSAIYKHTGPSSN